MLWSQVDFTNMGSSTFALTQPVRQTFIWCIFASARCLITGKPPPWIGKKKEEEGKLRCSHSLISTVYTPPPRQHNLHWEMSSCTEHDPRFHLLWKCLGCRRILAELTGLHFLWTHSDVGGYVSVITSWAKAYAVYSLEYFFFFFKGIPLADTCEI